MGGELHASVADNRSLQDHEVSEHMGKQNVSSCKRSIYDSQNGGVALGLWKICDKVDSNV